jgi:hypothetical protein
MTAINYQSKHVIFSLALNNAKKKNAAKKNNASSLPAVKKFWCTP